MGLVKTGMRKALYNISTQSLERALARADLKKDLSRVFTGFVLLVAILFLPLMGYAQDKSNQFSITSFHYDTKAKAVVLETSLLPKDYSNNDHRFTRVKQPSNELIISFPRAKILLPKGKVIPINLNGLKSATFLQPSEYSGTLLRINCDSQDAIANIQFASSSSGIAIYINPVKNQKLMAPENPKMVVLPKSVAPLPAKGNSSTIKLVKHTILTSPTPTKSANILPAPIVEAPSNIVIGMEATPKGIIIRARPGDNIVVKERMALEKPNRLVLDIADATLENTKLKGPINIQNPLLHQVRLGQFDASTVRVVVDTDIPGRLMVTYPDENKNTLLLSDAVGGQTYSTLPDKDQQIGAIQDIWVESKGENKVSIKISATTSMVRLLEHQDNKIKIQFINLFGREAPVYFDKEKMPFIQKIQVSPLQANEPNVKLVIAFDRPEFNLSQYLSQDGKFLELSMEMLPPKVSANTQPTADEWMFTRIPGKKLVVVDAGHGGKDVGATREGVYEKNMTLSIALKVRDALQKLGYQVVMTHATDKFLELSEITGITNKVKPDVFVSVHINSSTNPSIHGIETYFFTPQSRALADAVHQQMVSRINAPDRYVRSARFYVIRHTDVPAILCETGYISNTTERNELLSAERQQATADAIARGVTYFLNQKK